MSYLDYFEQPVLLEYENYVELPQLKILVIKLLELQLYLGF